MMLGLGIWLLACADPAGTIAFSDPDALPVSFDTLASALWVEQSDGEDGLSVLVLASWHAGCERAAQLLSMGYIAWDDDPPALVMFAHWEGAPPRAIARPVNSDS